jgi:TetR/AcrR family transcriptional regulator, fatty acid metabolism regulator protein
MTMESGERRQAAARTERKAEKRHAILHGAVRVFAEKGFFNATVAEIARAAGVADGTIYLYFKSKDELLLSIFDEKMLALCAAAREAIDAAPSASEALRRVAALHLAAVEANPSVAAVLIVELRQSSAFVRDAEKPRLVEYLDLIAQVVTRGQESGEFRGDVHPAAFKRAVFGALDEIALGWLLARRKFDLRKTAAEVAEMFVRGLVARPEGGA